MTGESQSPGLGCSSVQNTLLVCSISSSVPSTQKRERRLILPQKSPPDSRRSPFWGFFPPFLFLFFPFFYFIYAYARVPCVHRYPERPESISFPGAGVAGSCEPPDMGARRHTQVLCISSQRSSLWTIFQFAFFLAAVRAGHCKPHSLWLRVLPHIQGWL